MTLPKLKTTTYAAKVTTMNYTEFARLPIAIATAPENRQMLARFIASRNWSAKNILIRIA